MLNSAIRNFARAGYDGVGVRETESDAGVTAMMANRYFGSKERLFAAAVEVSFAPPAGDLRRLDAARARYRNYPRRADNPDADPREPFQIMLRSVSSPRCRDRAQLEAVFAATVETPLA